jgi:DNA-binding CsgD family transcriptional regulator
MYLPDEADASVTAPCVVILDLERRVLQASEGARRLLASCRALRLIHDRLCAATTKDGAELAAAFRAIAADGATERTVRLSGCGAVLDVSLVAIEGIAAGRQIVATVHQADQNRASHLRRAIRLFELTAAESRLLDILCSGASIPQAAALLGVARTTARTHLQRIFDKSGTRRQSDLQRLIFSSGLPA